MKKKIMLAIATLLVLGLTIVAFAYNTSDKHNKAMECCCKGKDSCPMKNKSQNTSAETKDCCDSPDCCCKGGDSCPMKNKTESTTTVDTKTVMVAGSEENCDKPCCKKKS